MSKKALVVDDNGSNLILEKDLLEVAGFEVFVAENAAAESPLPGEKNRTS